MSPTGDNAKGMPCNIPGNARTGATTKTERNETMDRVLVAAMQMFLLVTAFSFVGFTFAQTVVLATAILAAIHIK